MRAPDGCAAPTTLQYHRSRDRLLHRSNAAGSSLSATAVPPATTTVYTSCKQACPRGACVAVYDCVCDSATYHGHHRNPTLSYTQRLEERIKELEDQLASVAKSPASAAASSHSSPPVGTAHDASASARGLDEQGVTRGFRGLKIDDRGGITYHGTTSFFNLPSDRLPVGSDYMATNDSNIQRRERLVNNAWHQRALENLSDIPVRIPFSRGGSRRWRSWAKPCARTRASRPRAHSWRNPSLNMSSPADLDRNHSNIC